MDYLIDFVNSFVTIVHNILSWFLENIFLALATFVTWTFDGFFYVTLQIVNNLNFTAVLANIAFQWGSMDPRVLWVLDQSGIFMCMSLIVYAIGIRMILNLIPAAFTRI